MGMIAVLTVSIMLGLLPPLPPPDTGERGTRQVEEAYALRERTSGPLEEFRGGSNDSGSLDSTLYLGVLGVGLVVVLLYFGISALVKAAS